MVLLLHLLALRGTEVFVTDLCVFESMPSIEEREKEIFFHQTMRVSPSLAYECSRSLILLSKWTTAMSNID